jgi:hypothetical protein
VKWQAQRNRLAALAARLSPHGTVLKIEGGLPPDYASAQPQPPGGDLKAQHAAFARPAHRPKAPEAVSEPGAKIAVRRS